MSSPSKTAKLNLTPNGLFPRMPDADQDEKCKLISQVLKEMLQGKDTALLTQSALNAHAMRRYHFLSEEGRITISQADERALLLFAKGVSRETAVYFVSQRLTPSDASQWRVDILFPR